MQNNLIIYFALKLSLSFRSASFILQEINIGNSYFACKISGKNMQFQKSKISISNRIKFKTRKNVQFFVTGLKNFGNFYFISMHYLIITQEPLLIISKQVVATKVLKGEILFTQFKQFFLIYIFNCAVLFYYFIKCNIYNIISYVSLQLKYLLFPH